MEGVMARKDKYKREHFNSNEEYQHFRKRTTRNFRKWLDKHEEENPEHRERRILRQRLYSRYYWHTDGHQRFAEWLNEKYGIEDIRKLSIEDLRVYASKS